MGDHGRSQTARYPIYPLSFAFCSILGSGSDHHTHPANYLASLLRLASGVQPDVHDAWDDYDFLRSHAGDVWIRELFDSPHDWRARYGVSPTQRFQLLDDGFRRTAPLFQLYRRRRSLWRRKRSGRGMVRLRSPDLADVFS